MASRFEIVNEEYIEELQDKSENTKNNMEWAKVGEWKKLASKFRTVRVRCPRPTIYTVSVKHSEIQ